MKLRSNGVGQLIALRRIVIEASSPSSGATASSSLRDARRSPKLKTCPLNDNATSSSLVVPISRERNSGFIELRVSARSLTRRMPPAPIPFVRNRSYRRRNQRDRSEAIQKQ